MGTWAARTMSTRLFHSFLALTPAPQSTVKDYFTVCDDWMDDWVEVDPDEAYVVLEPMPAKQPKKADLLPETTFMSPMLRRAFERLAHK
mmetsp:Transcript_59821/g.139934  ORF Transcript_59821/g.139934 Transcript_59821/m.139934 type:complete len:89 (+) Transcript_59821:57-323(+)